MLLTGNASSRKTALKDARGRQLMAEELGQCIDGALQQHQHHQVLRAVVQATKHDCNQPTRASLIVATATAALLASSSMPPTKAAPSPSADTSTTTLQQVTALITNFEQQYRASNKDASQRHAKQSNVATFTSLIQLLQPLLTPPATASPTTTHTHTPALPPLPVLNTLLEQLHADGIDKLDQFVGRLDTLIDTYKQQCDVTAGNQTGTHFQTVQTVDALHVVLALYKQELQVKQAVLAALEKDIKDLLLACSSTDGAVPRRAPSSKYHITFINYSTAWEYAIATNDKQYAESLRSLTEQQQSKQ